MYDTRSAEKRSWLYRTRSFNAGSGVADLSEVLNVSRATKMVKSVLTSVEARKLEDGASGVL
jgi:hypothetical protein